MNCPYCNHEMKIGKIEASGTIVFTPDGEKKGMLNSSVSKNGKALSKIVLIRRSTFVPANFLSNLRYIYY